MPLFVVVLVCGCEDGWGWMLSVRLAGYRLCGDGCPPGCLWWCLWWRLFVLSFFPRDVFDEIWDLTGSVSGGFPNTLSN